MQLTGILKPVIEGDQIIGAVLILTRACPEFPNKICDLVFHNKYSESCVSDFAGKKVRVNGIDREGKCVNYFEVYAMRRQPCTSI